MEDFQEGAHLLRHPRRRLSPCGSHSFHRSCRELLKKAQLGMTGLNCPEMYVNLSHWLPRSLCPVCLPELRTQHANSTQGLRLSPGPCVRPSPSRGAAQGCGWPGRTRALTHRKCSSLLRLPQKPGQHLRLRHGDHDITTGTSWF